MQTDRGPLSARFANVLAARPDGVHALFAPGTRPLEGCGRKIRLGRPPGTEGQRSLSGRAWHAISDRGPAYSAPRAYRGRRGLGARASEPQGLRRARRPSVLDEVATLRWGLPSWAPVDRLDRHTR